MVSMCSALRQIKHNPFALLQPNHVEQLCRELGHPWRDGPLDPTTTIALFIQQVACGNCPCTEVRHLGGDTFSASAYCQARQRLPLPLLQELSRRVYQAGRELAGDDAAYRWHGHNTWIIDGSTFSMPDTPQLQAYFGQPKGQKPGCGFPVAHLLALFDGYRGLLAEPVASPLYTSDLKHLRCAHRQMGPNDLILGDDTFSSWAHFALILQGQMHALMPNQHRRIVSFKPHRPYARPKDSDATGRPRSRWIKSLGKLDQLVEWFKPQTCPWWMSREDYAKLPESIVVREIRRTIRRKGFRPITLTVVTTLLDPQLYPADELMQMRMRRWAVETDLKHLKTTMKMEVLHCKTLAGVQKELAVFVLVYNLVRVVMLEAARRQQVAAERISFADTLQWLRHATPDDELPALLVVPSRPDRVEPRAVKRRPKEYDLLNKPREPLRQEVRKGLIPRRHKY